MKKLSRILTLLVGLALIVSGIVDIVSAARAEEAALSAIEVLDGEGRDVATLTALGIESDRPDHAILAFALENRGERALTQLEFTLLCVDCEGNVISGKPTTNREFFMHDPIQAGETRQFTVDRYFTGAENTVALTLGDGLAADEAEVPVWTEPKPGNLLLDFCNDPAFSAHFENLDANPPVQMVHHVDQELDETVTDPDAMLAVIESLRNMYVGEESDMAYCDAGIYYGFTMADGSEWGVSFDAPGLLNWHGRNYEVGR